MLVRTVPLVSLLLACAPVAAPAQNAPLFATPSVLPAVFMVGADLAVGDFNGDGVPDFAQPNTGIPIGANVVTFRAKLLAGDGSELANATGPVPVGPMAPTVAVRAAAGDFDEDGADDMIVLTWGLGLELARNQGQSQAVAGFVTSVLVDDLNRWFGYAWPITLRVPVFVAADFDGDGHLDLLLAPVLVDYWTATLTSPGLFVWFGRGDGTFDPVVRAPLPSSPLDADWVDWNGDGVPETLVQLGQTVQGGVHAGADVTRFRIVNRSIVLVDGPQTLGLAHATSLAHLPPQPGRGTHHGYFVTGHDVPASYLMQPVLHVVDVDPRGAIGPVTQVALPAAMAASTAAELQAAQAADLDGDGERELVALCAGNLTQPGAVLVLLGPLDPFGSNSGSMVIGLGNAYASTPNTPPSSSPGAAPVWSPTLAAPQTIALADLDLDQLPDVLVGGLLLVVGQGAVDASAVLMNRSQPVAAPRGGVVRIGSARPTPAGLRPRCGTSGGLPVLGNAAFALTLGDAPRDALVAAVGASAPVPLPWFGVPLSLVPESYSSPLWVHAAAEGAGRARHALPLPNDGALLGASACFQWLLFDANSADPYPIYCSDALQITVGQRR